MAAVIALTLTWIRIPGRVVPWSAWLGRIRRGSDRGAASENVLLIVAWAILSLAAVVIIMLKTNAAIDHVSHP